METRTYQLGTQANERIIVFTDETNKVFDPQAEFSKSLRPADIPILDINFDAKRKLYLPGSKVREWGSSTENAMSGTIYTVLQSGMVSEKQRDPYLKAYHSVAIERQKAVYAYDTSKEILKEKYLADKVLLMQKRDKLLHEQAPPSIDDLF